jgi:hypothetical protein
LLARAAVATTIRVVTLMVGPRSRFAVATVGYRIRMADSAKTILATVLVLLTLQSRASTAVGAGLTGATAALLTTAPVLATAATAVTSTATEATTPSGILTTASAIAPAATTVAFGCDAAGRSGNNFELWQAGNGQRPLEQPLNVLEQRRLIGRHE